MRAHSLERYYETFVGPDSWRDRKANRLRNRFGALCDVCKSRIVAIVAIGFAAHWILELIAVAAIARFACS